MNHAKIFITLFSMFLTSHLGLEALQFLPHETDSIENVLQKLDSRNFPHIPSNVFEKSYGDYLARKEEHRTEIRKKLPHLTKSKRTDYGNANCTDAPTDKRIDCLPLKDITKKQCLDVACCWNEAPNLVQNEPKCYFSGNTVRYMVTEMERSSYGVYAALKQSSFSGFPRDISRLVLAISFCDEGMLRIGIRNNRSERYEVPESFLNLQCSSEKSMSSLYDIEFSQYGTLKVVRKNTKTAVFTTDLSQLLYTDQFLQLSVTLPSKYVYGLGDHLSPLLKDINWTKYTFFNRDQIPEENMNLYSSFPFYIVMENDGFSHGVYLFNSNAMDVILQPAPAVTFRTTGGILDFFVLLGPEPNDVVRQFSRLVGHAAMPPYWSLGFHLSRLGYLTTNKTIDVWKRTVDANIPFDTQWNDIDYMDRYNDFTYDNVNFHGLPEFVNMLHEKGMHYVLIIDPGISSAEPQGLYPPFDEGLKMNIFIKNATGQLLETKVWNKVSSVFPDFTNPDIEKYWYKQLEDFYSVIPFDGVWLDMNEPTNFLNGSFVGCPENLVLEHPPYVPGDDPLNTKTICMTAKHFISSHYNVHNIYGTFETKVTYRSIIKMTDKRAFVLTRAGFPGISRFGAMWNGDVISIWEHMRASIPSILSYNMAGIPMIGADICGFNNNTSVELCARWFALGAFYPFCRNHNSDENIEQDPVALGPVVVSAAKAALSVRYFLLPYLYTLFFFSHTKGDPVARPLLFEYPKDVSSYEIDTQFLWGSALMIMPALDEGVTQIKAYFPPDLWYDFYSGRKFKSTSQTFVLNAPLDKINLAIRGGYILPAQDVSNTTTMSRENDFRLIVALDTNGNASGSLYWDDGDYIGAIPKKMYNLIKFKASENELDSSAVHIGYLTKMGFGGARIFGVSRKPRTVQVNMAPVDFEYDSTVQVLHIENLKVDLLDPLHITW